VYQDSASVSVQSTIVASAERILLGSAATAVHAIFTARAIRKWEGDTPQAEVWTAQSVTGDNWTPETADSAGWTPQAAQNETWTPASSSGATWTRAA
jgi:hypothetical protein